MKHHLRKISRLILCLGVLALYPLAHPTGGEAEHADPTYLYRTSFVRAAPGKLLDLIQLYKDRMEVYDAAGDERPFWWRHTQGDQWDLMMIFPMKNYTEYYSAKRIKKRNKAAEASGLSEEAFMKEFRACASWHEDIFVMGPDLKRVKKEFKDTAYYHCEIFIALPGKFDELYEERKRENIYQTGIGRPYNMIFVRDRGASWDMYTLGCYRSQEHWAVPPEISREQRDAAVRKAGFEKSGDIGPYMRTLILMHRDTMGVAIR
jgi:hypothetical protein